MVSRGRLLGGLCGPTRLPLTRGRGERLQQGLAESAERLGTGDARFFADRLPPAEHWRVFPQFRRVAYLDIETTGLSASTATSPPSRCTTASVRTYVRGDNLDRLGEDLAGYRLLVTYNGKCFDVPFLRQSMGLFLDQPTWTCATCCAAWAQRRSQGVRAAAGHRAGRPGGRGRVLRGAAVGRLPPEAQPEGARDAAGVQHPGRGQPERRCWSRPTTSRSGQRRSPNETGCRHRSLRSFPSGQTGRRSPASGATTPGSGRGGEAQSMTQTRAS